MKPKFLHAVLMVAVCGLSACSTTSQQPKVRLADNSTLITTPKTDSQPVALQRTFVPVGPNMPTGLEREALNRFIREIDVLNIILDEAMSYENKNKRVDFIYLEVKHDIELIKNGVLDYMNARSSAPRYVKPIDGDYRQ